MANQKVTALTAASALASTDAMYVVQNTATTPTSQKINISALRSYTNVRDYGAKGDNSTDDITAITAAIAAAPTGGTIYFPPGTYICGTPIIITKNLHLMGSHNQSGGGSIICCKSSSFNGNYLIKNWSATEADNITTGSSLSLYPQIENLCLRTYNNSNKTLIGWGTINESGFIRDITMDVPTSAATGNCGIVIGSVDAGSIERITCYSAALNTFKNELRVGGGSDLKIDTWVTSQYAHSDSVFYFNTGSSRRMTNIHCEGFAASAASDAAIIRLVDCEDFTLSNSLISVQTVGGTSRPFLRATNSHGSGYSFSPPSIQDVRIYKTDFTTGNLIEDQTQSANIQNLAAATYSANYINRYDGTVFSFNDNSGSNLRVPHYYNLHKGLITEVSWASAAPTTGAHLVGDTVWNSAPASGGYMGWVCTTAATPGTWKGFGLIA